MKTGLHVFPTAVGEATLLWQENPTWRCAGIKLPPHQEAGGMSLRHPQVDRFIDVLTGDVPEKEKQWALDACDWGEVSGFTREVLQTLALQTQAGDVLTYGELARLAGRPGAARAVGTVMANNPFPLLCPCHRVIASGGKLGNFQAGLQDGRQRKRALLVAEGCTVAASLRE